MANNQRNKVKVKIRTAKKSDMPSVLALIKELALFEKSPEAVIVTVKDLVKDGFGKTPMFKVFVAVVNNTVAGMALIYTGYSTWKGKLVYLDDLVVKEEFRNQGMGKMLLDEVIRYAARENASVLKWQVLRWNKDAIRFYKRYNQIIFDDEWVDCKMYPEFKVKT